MIQRAQINTVSITWVILDSMRMLVGVVVKKTEDGGLKLIILSPGVAKNNLPARRRSDSKPARWHRTLRMLEQSPENERAH